MQLKSIDTEDVAKVPQVFKVNHKATDEECEIQLGKR